MAEEHQNIIWQGVINRLWTNDEDLAEYRSKFAVQHPTAIDKNNHPFHQYAVNRLPKLIPIKDGKASSRSFSL